MCVYQLQISGFFLTYWTLIDMIEIMMISTQMCLLNCELLGIFPRI